MRSPREPRVLVDSPQRIPLIVGPLYDWGTGGSFSCSHGSFTASCTGSDAARHSGKIWAKDMGRKHLEEEAEAEAVQRKRMKRLSSRPLEEKIRCAFRSSYDKNNVQKPQGCN